MAGLLHDANDAMAEWGEMGKMSCFGNVDLVGP